jgi:1-deoxy-D-xylulose 5-phosphate reductoisomerase
VAAFLSGRLSFTGIADLVELALERLGDAAVTQVDDVFALDTEVRAVAAALLPAGAS